MFNIFKKIFGTTNDNELKKLKPIVEKINSLENTMKALTDDGMRAKTAELQQRARGGESLDALLPETFALVREAAVRTLGQRPFDVQLIGGIVLHQGRTAEMRTGEGKTLTATLPAVLNSLTGKGVHIVTVNDYLAKFQSELMGKVYRFLGLTVGLVVHGMEPPEKQAAYAADITYGTNNEFGFDYLRDNMVTYKDRMVQRELNFAIVDEVDSILIDEARTPLIISGQGSKSTEMYARANQFVQRLREKVGEDGVGDYEKDEKEKHCTLTEEGVRKAEQFFGIDNITDPANTELHHHVLSALRANVMMRRDVDYVVKDGQVVIVDEFTGRLMVGRRYSDGLHQAIEAKEHVKVERESKTLATITFQNYFRMYNKLSGMTGTAKTEEEEFQGIYNLDVVTIPTNRPMIRNDMNDSVFINRKAKYMAVVEEVVKRHATGQPVLVGTVSVEISEMLGKMLEHRGVPHEVLNAKFHEKEAEIVAQAGKFGAVTVATNMAGRGTDIMLGGNAEYLAKNDLRKMGMSDELIAEATGYAETDNAEILEARRLFAEKLAKYKDAIADEAEKVRAAGGLFIIGTERHDSRRIDNQLRGRAGRQGDPGETRFYISTEDDLMRLFGGERITNMMDKLKVAEDEPVENKMLTRSIEQAQTSVESRNFQSRKSVLEYDDVMNKQREIIYTQRKQVLDGLDVKETILNMLSTSITNQVSSIFLGDSHIDENRCRELMKNVEGIYFPKYAVKFDPTEIPSLTAEDFIDRFTEASIAYYNQKEEEITPQLMREVERVVLLRVVDEYWMEHIDAMQELRQGIRLRAYANTDPVAAYQKESLDMFDEMISAIRDDTVRRLYSVRVKSGDEVKRERVASGITEGGGSGDGSVRRKTPTKVVKIGRNDLCPCGSGQKWKKCTCKEYHS